MTEPSYCSTCETELTAETTATYEGFDAEGYATANRFGKADKAWFTKCDDCFDASIDSYLESVAE